MRRKNAGSAAVLDLCAQQFQHLQRGVGVEVTRGFVRQHQARTVHQRAGKRHTLELAAGQLAWHGGAPVRQADCRQHRLGAPPRLVAVYAEQHEWQRNIVRNIEIGKDMKGLEHEPDPAAAQQGQRIVVEAGEVLATDADRTGIRAIKTGDQIEQRGFADPRFAHDRDVIAFTEREINTGVQRAWPWTGKGFCDTTNGQHGLRVTSCRRRDKARVTPVARHLRAGYRRNPERKRITFTQNEDQNPMSRQPAAVLMLAALLAISPGADLHAQAPAAPPMPVRVISFDGGWNLPVWAAQRQGYFEAHGVSVQLDFTPNSGYLVKSLFDGKYDIALALMDNLIAYQEGQGEATIPDHPDLSAFMGGDGGFLTVVAAPSITSFAQLKGKSLSVDAMTTGAAFVLRDLVARHGLTDADVTYGKAGGTESRYKDLLAGKHDATLLRTPFEVLAQSSGYHVLANASELGALPGHCRLCAAQLGAGS